MILGHTKKVYKKQKGSIKTFSSCMACADIFLVLCIAVMMKFDENVGKFSKTAENTVGKRRSCSFRAICLFHTVFTRDLFCRCVYKNKGLFGKGFCRCVRKNKGLFGKGF